MRTYESRRSRDGRREGEWSFIASGKYSVTLTAKTRFGNLTQYRRQAPTMTKARAIVREWLAQ